MEDTGDSQSFYQAHSIPHVNAQSSSEPNWRKSSHQTTGSLLRRDTSNRRPTHSSGDLQMDIARLNLRELTSVNDKGENFTSLCIPDNEQGAKIKGGSRRIGVALAFFSICVTTLLSALDLTSVSTALPVIVSDLQGTRSPHWLHNSDPGLSMYIESGNSLTNNPITFNHSIAGNFEPGCAILTSTTTQTTDFAAPSTSFVWVGSAFTLSGTCFLPWTGNLAMIWGRKAIFMISIALFVVGSAICGFAPSLSILILGRTLQGLGDGGIISLSEILVADLVPLSKRGTYEGLLGCVWAFASAIGPLVGGALASKGAWRWLFWINLPISAASMVLVHFTIRDTSPAHSLRKKLGMMDWIGNFMIIASLLGLTLALVFGGSQYRWSSPAVLLPLVLGCVLFIAFFVYEAKYAKWPTVPSELFAARTASTTYFAVFLHGLIALAVIYVLPSYFQACLEAHVLRSSVMILPTALTIAPAAVCAAIIVEYRQTYIGQSFLAWTMVAAGLGLMLRLDETSGRSEWLFYQIVLGIGLGILYVVPQFPILAAVTPQMSAHALAVFTFISSFGQTVGVTLGQSVLQFALSSRLRSVCGPTFHPNDLPLAITRIRHLPEPLKKKVRIAFAEAFHTVWLTILPLAFLGFLSCFLLKSLPFHEEKDEDYDAVRSR